MKRIVYATDYHLSDITSLKKLIDLVKVFKSAINVIHIADGEYTKEAEEARLEKFKKRVRQRINYKNLLFQLQFGDDVEKKLGQYIKKESINLLAISTKSRNLIEKLFGKSITRKFSHHTKIPLMVFHYKQESVVFI